MDQEELGRPFSDSSWLPPGTDMAQRVLHHHWDRTPLGSMASWPQELRCAVGFVLANGFPAVLVWGSDLVTIYNESFRTILGEKSDALGCAFSDIWGEAWSTIGPFAQRALSGEPTFIENFPLSIDRSNGRDRAFFTFSYSPVRGSNGKVLGFIGTIIETTESVISREASRESEARFRALVTAGANMIYRMSPDWGRMYQLDGNDILADTVEPIQNWADHYLLSEDRPTIFAAIDHAIRTKTVFEMEHRVRLAGGGVGWVLSRAVPILDSDGEILEWFGAGRDVTERHRAIDKLRDAEERYRAELEHQVRQRTQELKRNRDLLQATMDSTMEMIQVFEAVRDDRGRIVDFRWVLNNHTSEQLLDDVIGKCLLQNNPGVIPVGIFETLVRVTESGEPHQGEWRYVHEQFDGWFYQSVVKLGDGVATTTTDISKRKKAEEEVLRLRDEMAKAQLFEMEQRFREFAEASSDIIWIRNADTFAWEFVSPAIEHIYNVPMNKVLDANDPETWAQFIHPEDRERTIANVLRVREGKRVTHEFRIQRGDGEIRWIRNTDFPLCDANGHVQRIGGISQDVTEEKATAERMSVMVAELQHRTRNLIAVVRSIAAQTMQVTGPTEAFREEFGHRLEALARVQGLLSRSDEEPITIEALIRMELDALGARQLPERVHLEGPPVRIRPSVVQIIALALHELATNARKYGALSNERHDGKLSVTWCTYGHQETDHLALKWIEAGGQMPDAKTGIAARIWSRTHRTSVALLARRQDFVGA